MLVFTGNANRKLSLDICKCLGVELGKADVDKFPDAETHVQLLENVRDKDVYIIQPTSAPANQHYMDLLIMIDALKRASARRITAVIPYYGYGRQDRKDDSRVPITASLVANLLTVAGANRILVLDLHASQIQGFFDIPVDHLYAKAVFTGYIRDMNLKNLTISSTDAGGIKMARAYAEALGCKLVVIDKRRENATNPEVVNIIGEVAEKEVFVVDDMVSTAGSLVEAVESLMKAGAKAVYAVATHAVLCGPAIERLGNCQLKKLIVTDTIELTAEKQLQKIEVLSIAPLLAKAITMIHEGRSLKDFFRQHQI